ncbi:MULTISPECIES: DUF4302 domain-containing protein [unclassified Sphingobacterium]|uniref:DUF4302 domain-containing protein n=1 Tax=unclassified Sphingobacterium TaxID=2609468 RepID=UPI0020C3510F|nr:MULTISPECIES: DUF4302 domain-containing protein [unclassified Sphingobacterium]
MKKYIWLILSLCVLFSCKKGELKTFEVEEVWEKPEVKLQQLKDAIAAHKTGWEFTLEYGPNQTATYGYLGFNTEKSSEFMSDFSRNFLRFDNTDYHIGIVNTNASLSFPKTSKFGNLAADALHIDTLFTYKIIKNDTIILEGETKKSILTLTKCTPEKLTKLKGNSIIADQEKIKKLMEMPKFFFSYKQNGKTFGLEIDTNSRQFLFYSGTNQNPVVTKSNYFFNGNGLSLVRPIEIDGVKIKLMEGLRLNSTSLSSKDGINISNVGKPQVYDIKTAKEFTIAGTKILWWTSSQGFGKRNQPDIAGFQKLPNFTSFTLVPNYDYNEQYKTYFWFMAIGLRGATAGSNHGPVARFGDNGILRFIPFLEGIPSTNPAILRAMNITTSYIYNPNGFYIIKTGLGYTIVDATDGLTWAYFQDNADVS